MTPTLNLDEAIEKLSNVIGMTRPGTPIGDGWSTILAAMQQAKELLENADANALDLGIRLQKVSGEPYSGTNLRLMMGMVEDAIERKSTEIERLTDRLAAAEKCVEAAKGVLRRGMMAGPEWDALEEALTAHKEDSE